MSIILTIDTSTEVCSVALDVDGEIRERCEQQPRRHTALVLPMIDELMREQGLPYARLDAVAFGRGPGSFTGLRIATGVAQGLGFGLDIPLLPVSTLATLAWQAREGFGAKRCLACLDARIGELYWGLYRCHGEGPEVLAGEGLCQPGELPEFDALLENQECAGAGNGWRFRQQMPAWHQRVITPVEADMLPRAGAMAALARMQLAAGGGIAADQAAPLYLRDKVTRS